jgi:hypothetical protein
MKRNDLILMSLVALALSGCASSQKKTELERRTVEALTGGARHVQVYVVADADSEDLSIDEEPVHRKKNNDKDIDFELNGPSGYTFPSADALTFDDPRQAPTAGEITCTTKSSTWVSCTNKHREHGKKYKYTLRVKSPTGALLTLDPFINNH